MKRFHISIATDDYAASIVDYSRRLGCAPNVEVSGRYARWQTDLLNFTISCKPGQKGRTIRHIGFEDDAVKSFREEKDVNGLIWEYFSERSQATEIEEKFAIKQAGGAL
jgi:hypothetical protein